MPIRYKLTDNDMRTNGFQWELNKDYEIKSKGGELCTSAYFHFYLHPLLAVLHNPNHANIGNPRIFKAEVGGESLTDGQMKEGWKKAKLIKEIPLPKITVEQKIKYGIYCALEVYKDESFVNWANNWLSGKDRTVDSAHAAYAAHASCAAYATFHSAHASCATYAAAYSVTYAATYATTYAAYTANAANKKINLLKLAKKAME